MSPKAEGGFVEVPTALARGTYANPPEAFGDIYSLISRHVMVLVCNTMIDEEI